MSKEVKILLALLAIVGLGGFIAFTLYNAMLPVDAPVAGSANLIRSDSYVLGPDTAPVTIVEFLDPECEACKEFFPVVKQVLKENEGRVRLVVRYMGFHKSSAMAVAATEAAGLQGKYWEMQELLFDKAEEWGHKPAPDTEAFIRYAVSLGLDKDRFETDLRDPRWEQKLERDMEDGGELGVRSTPTIFVNGRMLRGLSYDALAAAVRMAGK